MKKFKIGEIWSFDPNNTLEKRENEGVYYVEIMRTNIFSATVRVRDLDTGQEFECNPKFLGSKVQEPGHTFIRYPVDRPVFNKVDLALMEYIMECIEGATLEIDPSDKESKERGDHLVEDCESLLKKVQYYTIMNKDKEED